jgi:hypothetical protein
MILAAFYLAVVMHSEMPEEVEVVTQPPQFQALVQEQPHMVSEPTDFVNNLHRTTFEQYASTLPVFPPPAPALSSVSLAEHFMYTTMHLPHVSQMSMGEYQQATLTVGEVVAHMWVNETASCFIRYGTVTTPYGNVYVTCALDEYGSCSSDSELKVHFDTPALESLLEGLAAAQPNLFPPGYVYKANKIASVADLEFIFGNGHSTLSVGHQLVA